MEGKISWKRQSITALLALLLIFGIGVATLALHGDDLAAELSDVWMQAAEQPQLSNRLTTLISGVEAALQSHVVARYNWIDLYGIYQLGMGRRSVEDSSGQMILKDNHGNLHFLNLQQDISFAATNYASFSAALDETAIPHLYVQLPSKKIPGYTILPSPMDNLSNEMADAFLSELAAQNLDYFDLRDHLGESGIPYEELFYRTDHHWQTPTAFWATTEIAAELERRQNWHFDEKLKDQANYETVTYPQIFLGSQGKRTGRFYAGVDDFTVIYPRHPGSFALYINKADDPIWRGTFRQTFIREEHLDASLPVYTGRYGTFLNYDMGLVRIVNYEQPQGKRIVVLKDSFTQALATFLAQYVQELYLIDLRAFGELEMPLLDTIRDIAPDYLLVLYNTEAFSKVMFAFE